MMHLIGFSLTVLISLFMSIVITAARHFSYDDSEEYYDQVTFLAAKLFIKFIVYLAIAGLIAAFLMNVIN